MNDKNVEFFYFQDETTAIQILTDSIHFFGG